MKFNGNVYTFRVWHLNQRIVSMTRFIRQSFFLLKFNITFFWTWNFFFVNASVAPVFYAIKHNNFQWFFFFVLCFLPLLLRLLMGKVCHCEWTGSSHIWSIHTVKIRSMFNTITITFVKWKKKTGTVELIETINDGAEKTTMQTKYSKHFIVKQRELYNSNWVNM